MQVGHIAVAPHTLWTGAAEGSGGSLPGRSFPFSDGTGGIFPDGTVEHPAPDDDQGWVAAGSGTGTPLCSASSASSSSSGTRGCGRVAANPAHTTAMNT